MEETQYGRAFFAEQTPPQSEIYEKITYLVFISARRDILTSVGDK